MSGWDGEHYPPSRPRKAAGGIKARSKRGPIGEQWWSRRFIEVLESLGLASRMSRGRSYARSGQVLGLDIGTGHVTAGVQGSRPKPYKVRLTVVPLTTAQWAAVEEALAARAVFRARLLAGEMPAEIEEVFAGCGTPLFPRTARDLEMSCSCPDWEVPCKHLAAVCYVLAEAFDDDPFAMLAWRGKGRDDLLAALRRLTGGRDDGGTLPVIDVSDRPLADFVSGGLRGAASPGQHGSFWEPSLSPARLRWLPPAVPAPPDLLLRSVPPPLLTAGGQDLPTLLRPAYDAMASSDADDPDPVAGPAAGPQPG
ncbi:MAG TPA: SWIM zinc finger family protein [Streptosporangiaceae bacterium]|nr:SWIM zinc finger family protein [Streptosporangiaceae bacterium]